MAKKKIVTDLKEIEKKVTELKIELLKQPTKKKSIKKEIARLLTEKNRQTRETKMNKQKIVNVVQKPKKTKVTNLIKSGDKK